MGYFNDVNRGSLTLISWSGDINNLLKSSESIKKIKINQLMTTLLLDDCVVLWVRKHVVSQNKEKN